MRVLSLFSGGGLGDYGLELAGMKIVGQVEIDDYCQKILKLRWPSVPKWRDIKEFKGDEIKGVDLVAGGFPCQDISYANEKAIGIKGKRSGLWSEMYRVICEVQPRFVLVENVSALLGRGLGVVLGDLAKSGYDAEWECIPASHVGAPHYRDRVWIVAYPDGRESQTRLSWGTQQGYTTFRINCENEIWNTSNEKDALTSTLGGMANGLTKRVDRLKMLGNGQVCQVVRWIGDQIIKFDTERFERDKIKS